MNYPLTTADYRKALEEGRFPGLRCQDCGSITFPPQGTCRNCQGTGLKAIEIGKNAVIRTYTVIRVGPEGKDAPYTVVMAELEEGPWVMGNLIDFDPENAGQHLIGRKVRMGSRPAPGDEYAEDTWALTFKLTG